MNPLWAVWLGFSAAIGATLGSFCAVCIDRLPADRSLLPRSHCEACGRPIRPYDLVPVVSWFVLRGRCRDCGAAIPPMAPIVESLVGILSTLLFVRVVPGLAQVDAAHVAAWVYLTILACALVILAYVDVRHRIIPDETTVLLIPVGLGGAALVGWLGWDGWPPIHWMGNAAGAVIGGGGLALLAVTLGYILRREALGWGDVKLVATLGAFLGFFPGGFIAVMLGSVIGAISAAVQLAWTRRRSYLPMGPFLALGALIWLLYGGPIVDFLYPDTFRVP